MKRRLVFLAAFFALLFASLPLFSRSKGKADIRYAFGSTIDLQGGFSNMPYSVAGESRNAFGISTGGEYLMRYSYFFGKHFGISAAYIYDGGDSDYSTFFGAVNKADGGRYKYAMNYDCSSISYMVNSFILSAVYRYDFGRWSLRPRLGIGVADYSLNSFSYERYDKNNISVAPQYHSYEIVYNNPDYMLNPTQSPNDNICFVGAASVQLTYSVADHFFFSAEIGMKTLTGIPFYYEHAVYDCKSSYNPSNWAEAVYQYNEKGNFEVDQTTRRSSSAIVPNTFFNLNIGIGWNIGWNRNYKRRK